MTRQDETQQWYSEYYQKKGQHRNDLRRNRGVLFQTLAAEAALVRAAADIPYDPTAARVLDVGCGGGGNLYQLTRLDYKPENISGIDILAERIAEAKSLNPLSHFVHGDATRMEFATGTFDLVFESTMFATLADDALSAAIAVEMVRVCQPGGYLLLVDWRTPKPRDPSYKALTRKRLRRLFDLGNATELVSVHRGALVPPLGRFLSARLPAVYFLVAALFPFLVGQVAYLLQKKS